MKLLDILPFFCIDYNSKNVYLDNAQHLNLALTPFGGTRISNNGNELENSYFQYGKIELEMMMATGQNVVTAIVLLAENKDEIDFEFVGKDISIIQSNLYYKGEPIYEKNAMYHNTNTNLTSSFNNYTIIWEPNSLKWYTNGQLLRTETTFPDSPSKLYIGIWGAEGVSKWAGTGLVFNAVNQNYTSVIKRIEFEKYGKDRYQINQSSMLKMTFFQLLFIKFNLFILCIF